MPTIYSLKPRFQTLLQPAVTGLARAGVSANQVTLAALALSALTGAALAGFPGQPGLLLLLPVVLLLRMALNAIDGQLARQYHMESRLGAMLNELGDVLSDSLLYLPFALLPGFSAALVAGVVLLLALSEMAGVLAQTLGAGRRYDGPLGKSDRAFAFSLLAIGAALDPAPRYWPALALGLLFALAAATVANRVIHALKAEGVRHGTHES
ncbi:MAG: CDP-alcohol phosphatidyltransferase family protein [Candidatus Cloacimonetes bacterium]|nr:CDP-alcohol phosphatidyltransferase family protein [Candidatus Cloacimonadota bacterium]